LICQCRVRVLAGGSLSVEGGLERGKPEAEDRLLAAVIQQLGYSDKFRLESPESGIERGIEITVDRAGKVADKLGFCFDRDTKSYVTPSFLREDQAQRPRQKNITDRVVERLNEGFRIVVEKR